MSPAGGGFRGIQLLEPPRSSIGEAGAAQSSPCWEAKPLQVLETPIWGVLVS